MTSSWPGLCTLLSSWVNITLVVGLLPLGLIGVDSVKEPPGSRKGHCPLSPSLSGAVETTPEFCVKLLAAHP